MSLPASAITCRFRSVLTGFTDAAVEGTWSVDRWLDRICAMAADDTAVWIAGEAERHYTSENCAELEAVGMNERSGVLVSAALFSAAPRKASPSSRSHFSFMVQTPSQSSSGGSVVK